jgi:HK97 gp10 family phage protein
MIGNIDVAVKLNVDAVKDAVKGKSDQALRKYLLDTQNKAKSLSPHLTGFNRDSIMIDVDTAKLMYSIFTTSNYGAYLELGTVKMKARPFIVPAALESIPSLDYAFSPKL